MKRVSTLVMLLVALAACEEKKTETKPEEKPPTTTGAATAVPTATTAQATVTINDSDLSTPADFEETAEKSITKTNYKTELASIEADVAKD